MAYRQQSLHLMHELRFKQLQMYSCAHTDYFKNDLTDLHF